MSTSSGSYTYPTKKRKLTKKGKCSYHENRYPAQERSDETWKFDREEKCQHGSWHQACSWWAKAQGRILRRKMNENDRHALLYKAGMYTWSGRTVRHRKPRKYKKSILLLLGKQTLPQHTSSLAGSVGNGVYKTVTCNQYLCHSIVGGSWGSM